MKLAKATLDKIEHLDDERGCGNGWVVTMRSGWAIAPAVAPAVGCHVFGEDTLREVRATMRRVKPCQCKECL